jgi:hypothetical protein
VRNQVQQKKKKKKKKNRVGECEREEMEMLYI